MSNIVYTITNTANRKVYVGKTTRDLGKRWREHQTAAARGVVTYLYHAMRKYGALGFEVRTVAATSDHRCLNDLERFYIKTFESTHPDRGYNGTDGGDGVSWWLGKKFSDSHCRRMSEVRFRRDIPNEEITRLYEYGLSCAAIAGKFSTCRETIAWRLRRLGVRMRPVGYQKKIQGDIFYE